MAAKQPATNVEAQSFENAIERLEHIVEEMETEKLPLADLLMRYEEGIQLAKTCGERLQAAEKRIELLSRNNQGVSELREFEAEDDSAPSGRIAPKASSTGRDDISLF